MKMSKKSLSFLLCVVFIFSFVQFSTAADKILLRAITVWPKTSVEHDGFFALIDEINKKLGDRVEIKYLGGPEVIPTFDQFEMLGKGTFDMGHAVGNYAKHFLPIAETSHLSRIKPWEERENGAYDILQEAYEKEMNLHYLANIGTGDDYVYCLYTNFPVTTLADFRGKNFRTAPVYVPLLKAVGAGAVSMPPGEIYTAMERGVVDGFGATTLGLIDWGWIEVTKYRVVPGFYPVGIGVYLNADKWKSLPADIRAEITEIAKIMERKADAYYTQKVKEEEEETLKRGLKLQVLPPEEAEKFLEMAFDEGWKDVIEKDPVRGPKLKELTTPK
jgi:TRAP-type C4-dicarboxylate transport system substrate-binding protein